MSSIDAARRLSIVIPVYNEEASLVELCDAISGAVTGHAEGVGANSIVEIVFVDDGSSDSSWKLIQSLAVQHDGQHDASAIGVPFTNDPGDTVPGITVRGLKLRRNFGKAAALDAGFRRCTGDVVFTMDADLQDDPKEVPRFLAKLDEGFDVVSGWKQVRHDPWHKVWPSRVFNGLVSRMTGVRLHDHNCGFKAYRRDVLSDVRLYGERHRFIPVLAAEKGWKVGEITVEHHARPYGHSKYGVSRLLKGFLDLLTIYFVTSFGKRPLHLIGTGGILCFALGGLGLTYLSLMWCLSRLVESIEIVKLHERAVFYYCILAILLGSQFMLAGLLAEFIVSNQPADNPVASIEEET